MIAAGADAVVNSRGLAFVAEGGAMLKRKEVVDELGSALRKRGVEFVILGIIWLVAPIATWVVATMNAPATVAFDLSRREIAWIAVAEVLLLAAVSALTRWWVRRRLRQAVSPPRPLPPFDEMQEDVLRLLWVNPANCWKLGDLRDILDRPVSAVLLACQRLQARGLIACNPHDPMTLVQLISEGREFAYAHHFTNADTIYARHPDAETLKSTVETPRSTVRYT
jgi:hypothetical protein